MLTAWFPDARLCVAGLHVLRAFEYGDEVSDVVNNSSRVHVARTHHREPGHHRIITLDLQAKESIASEFVGRVQRRVRARRKVGCTSCTTNTVSR